MVLMGRARKVSLFSRPSAKDAEIALEALKRFGMADFAQRSFHELSGGQRQLVILARAIVAKADILIMDEPASALDLKNQSLVLDWITRLSNEDGLTILFTTHHPHHALAVADNVLLMLSESEFSCGPAEEVLTEESLLALYGIPLKHIEFEHSGKQVKTLAPVF
jgi:iron complex transport system ATP-binding protein